MLRLCTKNTPLQGLFSCTHCGLQYNADLNGALNLLNRAKEQGFLAGAMAEAQKLMAEKSINKHT